MRVADIEREPGEVSVNEAAMQLKCALDFAYRLIKTGDLVARKGTDGSWHVSQASVDERLARLRRDPRSKHYQGSGGPTFAERVRQRAADL